MDVDQLLADDDVDVVAICSSHQFHAEQVVAVARAGKRGVLCETPLATTVEEAERITVVSAESGIPVVVGAMHAYDPAVAASFQALDAQGADTQLLHVRTFLPANNAMVDLATDPLLPRPPTRRPESDALEAEVAMLRGGSGGSPLTTCRSSGPCCQGFQEVTSAAAVHPFGYSPTGCWTLGR